MQDMTAQSWKRRGCSVVWSPELLAPLIVSADAIPLRTALGWVHTGLPDDPPAGSRTLLVGGLQTVIESFPGSDTAYTWLRQHVLPLCRMWSSHWDSVGLVFGVNGPSKLFRLNEPDDLVYFGKGSDKDTKLCFTRAIWNGAATGQGVFKLLVDGSREVGGFHVQRVS